MPKKIIIVGGVAGGASTAARLRRLDEDVEIVMFEKGEYISFANCGLPYYIGDFIKDRQKLIVQTVEEMSAKFKLDIRNLSEVIKIDTENKTVTIKNHRDNSEYEETFDTLVLSPGAKPIKPKIPGIDECKNLFTLRNIPDTDKIKSYICDNKPKKAVIIGAGFIGLEMAENLKNLGIDVTIIEASNQVMAPIDIEMAHIVHEVLIDNGVKLYLSDGAKEFIDGGTKVILNSGRQIEADMIILSIGVAPETAIAKEAGIKVNERGAIIVDNHMRTSIADIYALGDAAEVIDYVSKEPVMIPLAWPANRQGRIVADNICDKDSIYKGSLGSSVAKIFDYTVAQAGNNEKTLKRLGADYKAIHIHPGSHAGYYNGSFPIAIKMLFDPKSGKIYGAQAVGMEGVEKRVDVLATAIKGDFTVYDLQDIEVCYAPPYNSAKDPVNMLGYCASNIMEESVDTIQYYEVDELNEDDSVIVDVREEFELALGKFKNAINIPLPKLRDRLNEIPKDKNIYVTCQVGLRGYIATRILKAYGYNAKNIDGGMKTYLFVKNAEKAIANQNLNDTISKNEEAAITGDDNMNDKISANVTLDACGLQCPGPIKRVFEETSKMKEGDILEVRASDPGFRKDIKAWCERTDNTLIKSEFDKQNKNFVAVIKKGNGETKKDNKMMTKSKDGATLVVFSGDLDKAIASFIIATGAASMGKIVTMFFTFWGLNILKRKEKVTVAKNKIEKMFDVMLPSNTGKLPLSNMNMMGMGPAMIKKIMKNNNVDDLDTLIENAISMGVKVIACSMSMDLMGIKKEELLDGVEIGGVATYLGKTDDSGLNLFI